MSTQNIIRAWKDKAYRESLSEAERALLPENPAGLIELTDADLDGVAGGITIQTTPCGSCTSCFPCGEICLPIHTLATARCPSICQVMSC
jgi:mersacidin/lichenicidin family type 2 lantibiotic